MIGKGVKGGAGYGVQGQRRTRRRTSGARRDRDGRVGNRWATGFPRSEPDGLGLRGGVPTGICESRDDNPGVPSPPSHRVGVSSSRRTYYSPTEDLGLPPSTSRSRSTVASSTPSPGGRGWSVRVESRGVTVPDFHRGVLYKCETSDLGHVPHDKPFDNKRLHKLTS